MRDLQPAGGEHAALWRGVVYCGGLQRLLELAVCGPQGDSHPVGDIADQEECGNALNSTLRTLNSVPHVPRQRRPWRTPVPATAAGPAQPCPPPTAARVQRLQRLLFN